MKGRSLCTHRKEIRVRTDSEAELSAMTVRNRAAAATLGLFSASYAVLAVWYLYHDFFKYLGRGMPTMVDSSGYAVQISCRLWTLLPLSRLGLALAVVLLGVAAHRLWTQRPGARALALVTLWGVLLPQVLWFTEFVVDWHSGNGLVPTVVAGLALVCVPTMLLFEGSSTLGDWRPMAENRTRLLLTAIAAAWVAFGASEYLDHSYQLDSGLAYGGAALAMGLGILAVLGLLRLRVWGLVAAVAAAGSLAVVPLAFQWASYLPTGGYIDGFVRATSGCALTSTVSALVPLAVVGALGAPFLRSFAARLRG